MKFNFISKLIGTFRRKKLQNDIILPTNERLVRNLTHELRTALTTAENGIDFLQLSLPTLIDCYRKAKLEGIEDITTIPEQQLDRLLPSLTFAKNEIYYSLKYLEWMANNSKSPSILSKKNKYSVKKALEKVIHSFPYRSDRQQQLLSFKLPNQDFEVNIEPAMLEQIITNLIRNALFHIEDANRGEISIGTDVDEKYYYLIIRDTAKGIDETNKRKLFTRYYSSRKQDLGLGLAYCYEAMQAIGGKINCNSELGVYTEIELMFPREA